MTNMAEIETFGEIIDISDIEKASRGAVATYEQGLLDFMTTALVEGKCASVSKMAVERSSYSSEDDYKNAKQAVSAEIRKHFNKLVADGVLPAGSKVSINWHPETGTPQVTLRA